MGVYPTGVRRSMIFFLILLFALARQELLSTRTTRATSEILSLNFTAMEFSDIFRLIFYVLFLFEDFDLTTKRLLDICICLNHQELRSRLASLFADSKR